jgi:hypothetical protein
LTLRVGYDMKKKENVWRWRKGSKLLPDSLIADQRVAAAAQCNKCGRRNVRCVRLTCANHLAQPLQAAVPYSVRVCSKCVQHVHQRRSKRRDYAEVR